MMLFTDGFAHPLLDSHREVFRLTLCSADDAQFQRHIAGRNSGIDRHEVPHHPGDGLGLGSASAATRRLESKAKEQSKGARLDFRSRALERAALVQLLDNAGEAGIRGNINFA
jgi:hypothetical protein